MQEIDRRTFLAALTVGFVTAPLAVEAQPAAKLWRVGYLSSSSAERERARVAAFQQALQELGYLEGKSIVIEQRYAGGEFERLPELAAELARLKVDVFVVAGAPAAHAAKKASSVIPSVMTGVADPVGMGLVASLARPGGSITGLSDFNTGVVVKKAGAPQGGGPVGIPRRRVTQSDEPIELTSAEADPSRRSKIGGDPSHLRGQTG